MKQQKFAVWLISFSFSLSLLGCALTSSPVELNTVTPDGTPNEDGSHAISYTQTPLSILPTVTASATKTLNVQDTQRRLQELFENNGGCQLPCYWTIVPGETLWQDASLFLSSLGKIYGPGGTSKVPSYGIVFEGVEKPIGDIAPIFWTESGVVKAIGINSSWVRQGFDYSLSGLLKEFGKPDEIWIRSVAESSDNQPYYYLVLMYPSKGILVNLLGNFEEQTQQLIVCPQNIFSRSPFPPQLLLWNPKVKVTFDQFGKNLIDDDLGWVMNEYQPLLEVSSDKVTSVEFYNVYIDPITDKCIGILPSQ